MLPGFLVQETTVRESGESAVFEIGQNTPRTVLLTLSITHSVEQQNIHLDIYGSQDGESWPSRPLVSFPQKCYCGEYQMTMAPGDIRYLKAVWRVSRWARNDRRPFFRFCIFADQIRARVAFAGAA
jgi:hypothetical protein